MISSITPNQRCPEKKCAEPGSKIAIINPTHLGLCVLLGFGGFETVSWICSVVSGLSPSNSFIRLLCHSQVTAARSRQNGKKKSPTRRVPSVTFQGQGGATSRTMRNDTMNANICNQKNNRQNEGAFFGNGDSEMGAVVLGITTNKRFHPAPSVIALRFIPAFV